MSDDSSSGKNLTQLAALVALVAGAIAIWRFIQPSVAPAPLAIELKGDALKVTNADTGDPIEGAKVYIEPRPGNGPLVDANGNPVFWTTDSNGEVSPFFVPNWPPVQSPAGLIHQFVFVAHKPGFKVAHREASVRAGQPVPGRQLPFFGSSPR